MPNHVMVVMVEPAPESEQAFLAFEQDEHLPDVIQADGLTAAQLFRLADTQPEFASGLPRQRYLVIYEIEASAAETAIRSLEYNRASGRWRDSRGVIDPDRVCAVYSAVSDRIPTRTES